MRITSIGSEFADVREPLRANRVDAAHQVPRLPAADEVDETPDPATRRVEIAPQISEYMVRIYRERLAETGSKERAMDAVENSEAFRSVLKRHHPDVVTSAVEKSYLLDRIIRS